MKEFKLNDFYQAVVLKTAGFSLLRLERENPKFAIFVFADPEDKAQETISHYWNRKISVEARALIENINELKTRIYSTI
ncbi:MAG TPA: DUF5659 domain-containing protein [Patescibacteria group bacterium]|nr:DUF5659 domain-containing protein [Patescibacteria group bacterium]